MAPKTLGKSTSVWTAMESESFDEAASVVTPKTLEHTTQKMDPVVVRVGWDWADIDDDDWEMPEMPEIADDDADVMIAQPVPTPQPQKEVIAPEDDEGGWQEASPQKRSPPKKSTPPKTAPPSKNAPRNCEHCKKPLPSGFVWTMHNDCYQQRRTGKKPVRRHQRSVNVTRIR